MKIDLTDLNGAPRELPGAFDEPSGAQLKPGDEAPPKLVTKSRSDGFVEKCRSEIDGYLTELQRIHLVPEGDAMKSLAAISSRLIYLTVLIQRNGERSDYQALRTKEINPIIEHCDRLYKLLSRSITTAQLEWDIARGG